MCSISGPRLSGLTIIGSLALAYLVSSITAFFCLTLCGQVSWSWALVVFRFLCIYLIVCQSIVAVENYMCVPSPTVSRSWKIRQRCLPELRGPLGISLAASCLPSARVQALIRLLMKSIPKIMPVNVPLCWQEIKTAQSKWSQESCWSER